MIQTDNINYFQAKKEAEEKEKADKIRRNKELFAKSLKTPTSKKTSKRPSEADSSFLEEIKRLKAEKEKSKKSVNEKSETEKVESKKTEKVEENGQKSEEKKLTPAERLAKLREEMEKKRLESISNGKSKLDKTDMKLLFSQKW